METLEKLVSLAARLLLECGAETYRVEETVEFIALRMGVREAQVLALPTGCLYTLVDAEGKTHSRVVRVTDRRTDLNVIEQVNAVSRGLVEGQFDGEEAYRRMQELRRTPPQPLWKSMLAAALGAGSFAVLFGGRFFDALTAALCGALSSLMQRAFGPGLLPGSFHLFLTGMLSALIARLCVPFIPGGSLSAVIVGAIMPMLPGMLITNAIRDTVGGDLISGVARAAEALIRSAAIAAGVGLVLALWR